MISENLELQKSEVVKNAFEVMLESSQRGCIRTKTPKRSFKRKKIGNLTPKGTSSIKEWFNGRV